MFVFALFLFNNMFRETMVILLKFSHYLREEYAYSQDISKYTEVM